MGLGPVSFPSGIPGVGGKGGGGGGNAAPSPYENALSNIALDQYNRTIPMRSNLIKELTNVSKGNYDPTASPVFAPIFAQGKQGIEGQYGVAKENILANLPRGGAQVQALTNLEMGRAEQAGSLPALISQDIMTDMLNKTYGAAFNTPQQSMSGLGTAASSFGQRQSQAMAANAQEQAAKYQGAGQMAAMAMKAAAAGCWVAEVLYGKYDMRTRLARKWCAAHDNFFTRRYRRNGRKWADFLERHAWLKPFVQPIWDYMWRSQMKQGMA